MSKLFYYSTARISKTKYMLQVAYQIHQNSMSNEKYYKNIPTRCCHSNKILFQHPYNTLYIPKQTVKFKIIFKYVYAVCTLLAHHPTNSRFHNFIKTVVTVLLQQWLNLLSLRATYLLFADGKPLIQKTREHRDIKHTFIFTHYFNE